MTQLLLFWLLLIFSYLLHRFDTMDSRVRFHNYNRCKSGFGTYYEEQRKALETMKDLMQNTRVNPSPGREERNELMIWQKVS